MNPLRTPLTLAALTAALLATGCSSGLRESSAASVSGAVVQGSVHGGQQAVSNSTVQLYAVGTGGYGAAATPLLSPAVTTSASGGFSITGAYSCSSADQVYIVATGGNPGLAAGTNNSALAIMAALGSCSSLQANASTTFINLNEVTTVAAAWSLARFMTGPANAGTSSTNVSGLLNAFAAAGKVASTATGYAPGPALPPGATVPVAKVNTLANILAACINSDGSVTATSNCGKLFAAATPPGGSAPTDTITAALNIARNPGKNVSALLALSSPIAPFQPSMSSADNFLIGVRYSGGGLAQPVAIAADSTGNIWLANSGNNSVSEFASSGVAISPSGGFTGGGLSVPSGVAIDLLGNAWISNSANNSVTKIAAGGASFANYTGGGLNIPSAVAIDGASTVWVTNSGNNTVTALTSAGTPATNSPYTGGGTNRPVGVAINSN